MVAVSGGLDLVHAAMRDAKDFMTLGAVGDRDASEADMGRCKRTNVMLNSKSELDQWLANHSC